VAQAHLSLILLTGRYSICQVDSVPELGGEFYSVVRTPDELSVICEERFVPPGARHEPGWRVLRFAGTFAFSEIGVLASVATPLKDAGITILAVSTFDTDYVLIKDTDLDAAKSTLQSEGHHVTSGPVT
jgi:hypothetical protein